MSVAQTISYQIKHMTKARPFHRDIFSTAGSSSAVSKALSQMVRAGLLQRVARGIYMRPKRSEYIGQVYANPLAVMGIITRANGEVVQIHGAEAVRRLGLSTQMQVLPTYYTSGYTREIKVGNTVIRLRHVSKERLQHAGTKVGLALTALYYLGRKGSSALVISRICKVLNDQELTALRACVMPIWMQAALSRCYGGSGEF
ncbi:DUF6088 family protein [Pseudomonas sp. EA_65y_Pfl1_P120]|uniref:DUF6088 family protein n=1 Tax=Pseudomonas sp. EA_65y_Pfl1_P120 TaxID=3088693 RepID=UPI0030DBCC48